MNKRHYEHTLPNIRGSLSNTYIKATTSSEGLMEARHRCMYCDAEYMVGYTIPKINPSSRRSGGSGGGGGGSFGGGSSGGGGSSSRF